MFENKARLSFDGPVSWDFSVSSYDNFDCEKFLADLVNLCGYTHVEDTYKKEYNIFENCCTACQEEKTETTLTFINSLSFRITCNVPYASYELHPRRELEGALKISWDMMLHDLLIAGIGFDDDVYKD